MPYPNEHACRLADPGQFERFNRKNGEQEHEGKAIDVIYGIKGGKSTIQALRYDKDTWTSQSASAHCKSRKGSFEAASKESSGDDMSTKFKEAEMSMEDKRRFLQSALQEQMGYSTEDFFWIEDIWENTIVYDVKGQTYQVGYKFSGESVEFGAPEKVVRQTVYKPIESLQRVYSDIIQESGKRNASIDSDRIKKIMKICQELLSSEPGEDEDTLAKIKKATKEAESVLSWLREQENMKTEDGEKYPASAYAYVPDPDKPSTWKLRLWQSPSEKVTRSQLGRAAAALSPGGFRGQKVEIPSDDLSAVKRKIRSEYRKLDVDDEDIPKWVKESETRELILNYIPLTEAKFEKGRAHVVVIKPGFNVSQERYYPADMLKRDYKVFEGQKMFADHPTEDEEKNRPERSIKDWVATLSTVECDDNGIITGIAEIVEPWLMQKLASLRDKGMLSEMGISINAVGSASKDTIEGKDTLVIEKLVSVRSVDFVTEPGAGGTVTFYESDRRNDIDLIEISTLREKRPDLIKIIENEVREKTKEEVKQLMENENRVKELETENDTLKTENDGLKTENTDLKNQISEAQKEKGKAEAQATIKEAVEKAELPQASKDRLLERFKDAETAEGIQEAIKAEVDYIAQLTESGVVKGLGETKPDPTKTREELKESFRTLHPEWSEEELETAVSGK